MNSHRIGRSEVRGSASRAALLVLALLVLAVGFVVFLTRGDSTRAPVTSADGAPLPNSTRAELAASNDTDTGLSGSSDPRDRAGAIPVGVRLPGPGRLEGRVIERASGAGVGGARVDLLPVPPAGAAFMGRMLRVAGLGDEFSRRVLPVAVACTEGDGRFRFEGVRTGTYYLDARGERHVPESVVRARVLASGAGGPVDVFVTAGGRVLGKVLLPDGRPAKIASLALVSGPGNFFTSARSGDMRWLEAKADERGHFLFGGVPAGVDYEITVSGSGFALSHALGIEVKAGQDTEVTVQTRVGGTIVGRVLGKTDKEDVPVANAHLGVVPRGLRNLRCVEEILEETHCVSAADGSYVMKNVPPGENDVLAIAWGRLPAVGAHVAIADAAEAQANDIVLASGPMVTGRVVDAQGAPIAGVEPHWNLVDWKNFQFDFTFAPLMMQAVKGLDLPKTDADGRFTAGPIAGSPDYSITFMKTGFVEAEFKWNPERDGSEISVVMQRGSAVEGIVMDAAKSEPVTSFTVSGVDRVDMEGDAPSSKNPFSGGQLIEDQAGRFHIDSVKPGKASLTFAAPGYLARTVDDIDVVEGKPTRGLIVKLTPGGVVRGKVVDANGAPVPGAQVLATSGAGSNARTIRERQRRNVRRDGPRGFFGSGSNELPAGMTAYAASMGLLGDKTVSTNAQGVFELSGVDPGPFKVLAFHRDHTGGSSSDLVMGEEGLVEGVVVTMPKGGGIEGVVHDRHGVPVANELVVAFSPSSFDGNQASAGAGLYQGHSDSQGRYSIVHVAPGGYFLVATRGDEDLNPMSFFGTLNFDLVTVPVDETVTFDLVDSSAGACRVYGIITYAGEPIGKANLTAMNFETDNLLGVEFKVAKMMEGGRYEFAGLAPGEYELHLDGAGPQVRMTLEVPDQAELRADLALPEGGLEGRVVDEATNGPIEGADVVLRPKVAPSAGNGLLGKLISREGRASHKGTDDKGAFQFERLAGTDYELTVRPPRRDAAAGKGAWAPSDPLTVHVDENRTERNIVVRLPPSLGFSGRVVDVQKNAVKGATVLIGFDKSGFDVLERAKSDDEGRFEVAGLAPGLYKATATATGFADGSTHGIKIERGVAKVPECEIAMQKGVHVTVRVYGSNGSPVSGARAELYPTKGEKANDPANAGKAIQNMFTGEGASGADGRIDLGRYMPGEYRLEAQRGFSKATDPKVTIAGGRDEVELKIELP